MAEMYLKGAARNRQATTESEDIPDEVRRFLKIDSLGMDANPLAWWKMHEKEYPVLAKMARDILAIPASSSECERIFSAARNNTNWNQARTGETTFRNHVFVKMFLRYNDEYGGVPSHEEEPDEYGLTRLDRLLFGE